MALGIVAIVSKLGEDKNEFLVPQANCGAGGDDADDAVNQLVARSKGEVEVARKLQELEDGGADSAAEGPGTTTEEEAAGAAATGAAPPGDAPLGQGGETAAAPEIEDWRDEDPVEQEQEEAPPDEGPAEAPEGADEEEHPEDAEADAAVEAMLTEGEHNALFPDDDATRMGRTSIIPSGAGGATKKGATMLSSTGYFNVDELNRLEDPFLCAWFSGYLEMESAEKWFRDQG